MVLDSDRVFAQSLGAVLSEHGLEVTICASPEEAIRVCDELQPDCVVLELTLHQHSGLEFLYEFRSYPDWLDVPVWIYTQISLPDTVMNSSDWRRLGAQYVSKSAQSPVALAESVRDRLLS